MITTTYTYSNAAIGDHPSVFEQIHAKEKNIAILQRNIDALQEELTWLASQTIECRASGTFEEIAKNLSAFKESLDFSCDLFFKDAFSLLEAFAKTTQASHFRLLLATVESSMCRKLHTDVNDLRLLCTYIGPGTVWVPDEAINQEALQARKSNEEIVLDEKLIQQAATGDVVILKGALYPDAQPILHRSPVLEQPGSRRLLLRIDTNSMANIWA